MGKALIGKKKKETITVTTPAGEFGAKIIYSAQIKYTKNKISIFAL